MRVLARELGFVGDERKLESMEGRIERRRREGWERGRRSTRRRMKRMCLHGMEGSGQEHVGDWERLTV